MATLAKPLAIGVEKLGREGAFAHAGRVGLDDAKTKSTAVGPRPVPVAAMPASVLEEVT